MNQHTASFKPELLLPVGSAEAFYAALNGGADAIYLGLNNFNARKRADNFTPWQVASMVKTARKKGVKVYITLNTVIRNNEINQLINTLFILSQIKPDAIIVQDWGVYYLARKFFPMLTLHASTQMAIHNSTGIQHAAKMGFKRVVVARELTKTELETMSVNRSTEIELFIHGALCYSFSGMCLFSSYLGGASANRGLCAQPCRRVYRSGKDECYFFSLKDNQLAAHLPFIEKLKIDSLKIEGRLKSAEYVYQTAVNYRKLLDHKSNLTLAEKGLQLDFGREKTDYFMGKHVSEAITQSANTGLMLGMVSEIENGKACFSSQIELKPESRLRFRNKKTDRQTDLKMGNVSSNGNVYQIDVTGIEVELNDEVYLIGTGMKFPSKIVTEGIKINDRYPEAKLKTLLSLLGGKINKPSAQNIYVRIDNIEWLKCFKTDSLNNIILSLGKQTIEELDTNHPLIRKNSRKLWIELPKFIAEDQLVFYQKQLQRLGKQGLNRFSLSHISQKELLPKVATFITNENVYAFNDAAISLIKSEGAASYIYPFENDIVNLSKGNKRDGIVPLIFNPNLFYSRMPVKVAKDETFSDKTGQKYRKTVRDGITIILPEKPVSLTRFKQKLDRYGFGNYLIDLSFTEPSGKTIDTIMQKIKASESVEGSSIFNFKRELK